MNRPNYCPVNSITQVTGQFPSEAHLFVYTKSLIYNALGKSARLWRPSIQVIGHQDMKQGVHWRADFISHAYYFCSPGEFRSLILGLIFAKCLLCSLVACMSDSYANSC